MAKMSAQERAELEARLAADDDDDDDDEVTISHGGSSFTGTFRRAKEVAAAWGVKLKVDPPPDDDGKKVTDPKRFTSGRRTG